MTIAEWERSLGLRGEPERQADEARRRIEADVEAEIARRFDAGGARQDGSRAFTPV